MERDGRAWDVVWDVASVGFGVHNLVKNLQSGNVDAAIDDGVGIAVDLVSAFIPFVPGGVGAVRAGVKTVDFIDGVYDAGKLIEQTSNSKEVVEAAAKAVHGNSKASMSAQYAYDIIDSESGVVVKTGVSSGRIRKDGKSSRAEQQVRKWNREENTSKYKSVITHKEPQGEGARERILNYEKQRADYLRNHKPIYRLKFKNYIIFNYLQLQ